MADMIPPLPAQLASDIDSKVRMYVESFIYHVVRPQFELRDTLLVKANSENTALSDALLATNIRISELEKIINPDDKYLLTKGKLIAFMKQANIT